MNILGLNVFHADAAAVVLKDGEIAAAIAEERLNRVKHFAGFPAMAIKACLDQANLSIADIDAIGIARDGKANLIEKAKFAILNLRNMPQLAKQRLENRAKVKSAPELLASSLGIEPGEIKAKFVNVEHHLAHMSSAFFVSNFDEAAVMSIDGMGDFASTMIGHGEGTELKVLDRVLFPHSMGIFYTMVCQFIGYDRYGDEGKVMGLAPYGEPAYMDFMDELVRLKPNGKFELNLDYFIHHSEGVDYSFDEQGYPTVAPLFSDKMVQKFGAARKRNEGELTDRDKNLAASLQRRLEQVYFHVLGDLAKRTGSKNLCLAGGVSLNSVANGMIFDNTPFEGIYCQPAATDDGTALGAALYIHHVVDGKKRERVMNHAYTGPRFTDAECKAALDRHGVDNAQQLPDEELYVATAQRMAEGKIVGWFQGAMEWGPRALGSRSIVCHPGHPNMKDILNSRIKQREWFRPFAPSVLAEQVGTVFEQDYPSPYMMLVYKIRPEWRERVQAINHVDNTGRLQSVTQKDSPRYHALISAFHEITGVPLILNTSFNENEPIVCTPDDAINCFLRTKMDTVVLGNWLVDAKQD